MIVAEQKPLADIKRMMKGKKKVLAVGCGTCVSVCFSGGKKETDALATALTTAAAIDGEVLEVEERTVQRQCVQEFVEPLREDLKDYDAVLSLGCEQEAREIIGKLETRGYLEPEAEQIKTELEVRSRAAEARVTVRPFRATSTTS